MHAVVVIIKQGKCSVKRIEKREEDERRFDAFSPFFLLLYPMLKSNTDCQLCTRRETVKKLVTDCENYFLSLHNNTYMLCITREEKNSVKLYP